MRERSLNDWRFGMAALRLCGGVFAIMLNINCLSEQSFQITADASRAVSSPTTSATTTRDWLQSVHADLQDLLPAQGKATLVTDDLVNSNGQAVDVYAHFGLKEKNLRSLLRNLDGLRFTAQGANQDVHVDEPPPAWPGFVDVAIPIELRVDQTLALSGRLGWVTDDQGAPVPADCIVILPGFFGDNWVQRTEDLGIFLHQAGFHVLALEIRGHGQTERFYPEVMHTFGVMETDDLMQVDDWLATHTHVRRTGLVGYCWGANVALLSAWYDGRDPQDPSISRAIAKYLVTEPGRPRYTAGVIAFSPIVAWEALRDDLATPRSYFSDPVYATIQRTIRDRMERKRHDNPCGDLRVLIEAEYLGQPIRLPGGAEEGFPFLRLITAPNNPPPNKLDRARMPVLIVHGADDPLSPAQDIADFVATVNNPQVATVILPSGGHVGFAAYARDYYYSLIRNFFGPGLGPSLPPLPYLVQTVTPSVHRRGVSTNGNGVANPG